MQYMLQGVESLKIQPRVIIHGGAGNIRREDYPPEKYQAYREALIDIVSCSMSASTTENANTEWKHIGDKD